MNNPNNQTSVKIETCDLCVIGAGLAGLNALHVSSRYLPKDARVLVFDKQEDVGGMWRNVYNHVRLHQPHKLFTAGNIEWKINKKASYLANKQEILEQFQHCWKEIDKKTRLTPMFGYTYQGHEEVKTGEGYEAHIRFTANEPSKPDVLVHAKRCIKAFGFNVTPNKPLSFSSDKVKSIASESPEFMGEQMSKDQKPVYIVGGGKTGTDAAYHLVKKYPNRKVEMLIGGGTAFINRAEVLPNGGKRLFGGTMLLDMLKDVGMHYDGTNDDEAFEYFVKNYGLKLKGKARRCFFGVISPEEIDTINQGVSAIQNEYLEDVVEENGKVFLKLRSGEVQEIEEGSWVINCTGHLLTKKGVSYEPYLSPHSTVLSIQQTSALTFVTSFGAYFLPHLWFLDKLPEVPIYVFNHDTLHRKAPTAYYLLSSLQVVYNVVTILNNTPPYVLLECGINFDNWYPLYRNAFLIMKLKLEQSTYMPHFKEMMDKLNERLGLQGGPLYKDESGEVIAPLHAQ